MFDRRSARALGGAALGVGVAAFAGGVAVRVAGHRIRSTVDADLDPQYDVADTVVHHHVMTADGATIHVVERHGHGSEADARPLLLLHGWALQWWIWAAQFNTVSQRYRLLAWDMRGHGRSTVGRDGVTLSAIADDLATVLEALELSDVVVVGHSMGGMALGEFCARHPQVRRSRVSALMFLATSAATMALPGIAGGAVGLSKIGTGRFGGHVRAPRLRWRDGDLSALVLRPVFGRHASGRAVDIVRRMIAEMDPDVADDALRAAAHHDVRDALGDVETPTMVVVGSDDRLTPPSHARIIERSIEGADLVVLPHVGHQVMQEAPAELAALIDQLDAAVAIDLTDTELLR